MSLYKNYYNLFRGTLPDLSMALCALDLHHRMFSFFILLCRYSLRLVYSLYVYMSFVLSWTGFS